MNTILSIVIVVKNGKSDLSKTLNSIAARKEDLLKACTEIVIIDGLSTDGSWDLATITEALTGIKTHCYQQPPRGIYQAMNLGHQKSQGEWILYINAGDLLFDCSKVHEKIKSSAKKAIQFRSAIKRPNSDYAYTKAKGWDSCHQALIYRKSLHESLGNYDERLSICSDSLFINAIEDTDIEFAEDILSVTQVSPKNASRNYCLIKRDLKSIKSDRINHSPWQNSWATLATAKIESILGISLSVWTKCHLGRLRSRVKRIYLPQS